MSSPDAAPPPLHEALERRSGLRQRRRTACLLETQDRSHPGTVVDSGPEGLHIETEADLRPGAEVAVVVSNGASRLRERGLVVFRRQVPRSLAGIAASGIGVRLGRRSALHRLFESSGR